jgi:hypothetical protein
VITTPSETRAASALDTVTGLTPSRRVNSRVDGSRSPARRRPASVLIAAATVATLPSAGTFASLDHALLQVHSPG